MITLATRLLSSGKKTSFTLQKLYKSSRSSLTRRELCSALKASLNATKSRRVCSEQQRRVSCHIQSNWRQVDRLLSRRDSANHVQVWSEQHFEIFQFYSTDTIALRLLASTHLSSHIFSPLRGIRRVDVIRFRFDIHIQTQKYNFLMCSSKKKWKWHLFETFRKNTSNINP